MKGGSYGSRLFLCSFVSATAWSAKVNVTFRTTRYLSIFPSLTVTFWPATHAPMIPLSDLDARWMPFSKASSNDLEDEQMIAITFATELNVGLCQLVI